MSPNSAGVSAGIDDPHRRVTADATDVDTPYVDVGPVDAPAVVFPHGHPTWSYLWRNVIAPLAREFRCLAPDLPGMGRSAPSDGRYRFLDHACHLDACFTAVLPEGPLALVAHDWDVALRLGWAGRYPERLRAFAHVEGVVRGRRRADSPGGDAVFRTVRNEQGEATVRGEDMFVERMLPMGPCGIWIRARSMPTSPVCHGGIPASHPRLRAGAALRRRSRRRRRHTGRERPVGGLV